MGIGGAAPLMCVCRGMMRCERCSRNKTEAMEGGFFFLPLPLQSIIWEGGGNKTCAVGFPHEVRGCAVEEEKPSTLLMLHGHRK